MPQPTGADIAAAWDRNDILLPPSGQILDGVNRPTGNFSDICTGRGDVAEHEESCKRDGEPNDIAVHLFDCHHHHGMQEVMPNVPTEIKVRYIQVS